MSNVYIVDGDPHKLKALLLEAVTSKESFDVSIRALGETGIKLAHLKVDTLHILQDETLAQLVTDDERSFPVKFVAVGKAAIGGSVEYSATLTVHEHKTAVTPVGELEVLENGDLG